MQDTVTVEPDPDPYPEDAIPLSGALARARRSNRGSNGGTSRLPPGKCWAPHEGYNVRLRRHKQVWAQFEKLCLRDGYARVTRERLLDFVAEMHQHSEIAAMAIALAAKVRCAELKITWTAAINQGLNELEKAKVDPTRGIEVKV